MLKGFFFLFFFMKSHLQWMFSLEFWLDNRMKFIKPTISTACHIPPSHLLSPTPETMNEGYCQNVEFSLNQSRFMNDCTYANIKFFFEAVSRLNKTTSKEVSEFDLNYFTTTPNFIPLHWEMYQKKKPRGFALCWPHEPPAKVKVAGNGIKL